MQLHIHVSRVLLVDWPFIFIIIGILRDGIRRDKVRSRTKPGIVDNSEELTYAHPVYSCLPTGKGANTK